MEGSVETRSYTKRRGDNKKKDTPIENKKDHDTHGNATLAYRPFDRQEEGTTQIPEYNSLQELKLNAPCRFW